MCGIVGFYSNTTLNEDRQIVIANMVDILSHRGPDHAGCWVSPSQQLALGHRRLAIIDLSPEGHQPMHSACGRYVMVYNGQVYNYLQLREDLIARHHSFSGHSDSEVILALISEYGLERALQRMTGMFAIALWDEREQILHLARDRVGEKPLYYGWVNNLFVFASELKAIRALPRFNNTISTHSLGSFMQFGYVGAPYSIYNDIFKLSPGTYLTIHENNYHSRPAPQTYWSMQDVIDYSAAHPLKLTDAEAIEELDTRLNHIIGTRVLADVPVGSFLSGGIDSSTITALMQANSSKPVKSFTIGFNEKSYNEAEYAKRVANHLQTDHTELYLDASDALAVIPQLPIIYDEPFADSSAIPTFLVSRLAKTQVSVCLSGDGGDELFGGYNRYLFTSRIWRGLSFLPYPLRIALQKLLQTVSPIYWDSILSWVRIPRIGDRLHNLANLMTMRSPDMLYNYLISQWGTPAAIVNNLQISSGYHALTNNTITFKQQSFTEKMMVADTLAYLPDDIMVKVDRAGMANSLETRASFLDHELIEFVWRLPLNMKIRNNQSKWLLRKVLEKYVPEPLLERPKMGFGIPLDLWLRGPLRDWAEDLLAKNRLEQHGMLNSNVIIEKWQEHLSGKCNRQYQLWSVLMFQAWIENTQHGN